MGSSAYSTNAYRRVDIETASQGKLIVMLFGGAIRYAEEAKRAIKANNPKEAHDGLVRAQDIVSELRAALNMNAGEVADNLDRTYEYLHHLLVSANVKKDPVAIDECVKHLSAFRDTWDELFDVASKEEAPDEAPVINKHGASVMNLEG